MSWWLGVPPAEAEAGCGHPVRWEAGRVRVPKRTGCRCAEHAAAWARHAGDPRVLVLGPRRMEERTPPSGPGWGRYAPTGVESLVVDDADGLLPLLQLGGGLPQRLVATVAAAHLGARADARLDAALYGRAHAALDDWLGAERPSLWMDAPPELVRVHREIRATLPFAWLVRVWARGLATVNGRFCLDADTGDGRTFTLSVVAPDLGPPETLTLTMPA